MLHINTYKHLYDKKEFKRVLMNLKNYEHTPNFGLNIYITNKKLLFLYFDARENQWSK